MSWSYTLPLYRSVSLDDSVGLSAACCCLQPLVNHPAKLYMFSSETAAQQQSVMPNDLSHDSSRELTIVTTAGYAQ